ncbi:hypothetical protein [Cryobacterium sp. BB307]|uniref:PKD domain-containing protein n=1 Tax=Cryobacterium sp. BB307 TaxID=2716317 RepID=UPI001446DC2E|nr:hypothetical protein [Cryobacterium sp. BB307]
MGSVTTLLIAALVAFPSGLAGVAPDCTSTDWLIGECPYISAGIEGDGVVVRGEQNSPGNSSGGSGTGTPGTNSVNGQGTGSGTGTTTCGFAVCRDNYTATAPVTLADLVNFRPTPGTDSMQPNGWMVVGLHTNFYAQASVQVQSGQLLGQAATVRFTPVRYHWTYGDGSARSTATPGATWQAQGLGEFEPTATSHSYRSPGTYVIDLTIDFAAEYHYGASTQWVPIAGVLPVPANRLVAVAGHAKTVLVEHHCAANPSGPGC